MVGTSRSLQRQGRGVVHVVLRMVLFLDCFTARTHCSFVTPRISRLISSIASLVLFSFCTLIAFSNPSSTTSRTATPRRDASFVLSLLYSDGEDIRVHCCVYKIRLHTYQSLLFNDGCTHLGYSPVYLQSDHYLSDDKLFELEARWAAVIVDELFQIILGFRN